MARPVIARLSGEMLRSAGKKAENKNGAEDALCAVALV
jgi:hypothetical protein